MSYKTRKRRDQRRRSEERRRYWIDIRLLHAQIAFEEWKKSYVSPFAKSSLASKDHLS